MYRYNRVCFRFRPDQKLISNAGGDPSSGDAEAAEVAGGSATAQVPPAAVVSKLVRGGPATTGSSGPQVKRPSRSAM